MSKLIPNPTEEDLEDVRRNTKSSIDVHLKLAISNDGRLFMESETPQEQMPTTYAEYKRSSPEKRAIVRYRAELAAHIGDFEPSEKLVRLILTGSEGGDLDDSPCDCDDCKKEQEEEKLSSTLH